MIHFEMKLKGKVFVQPEFVKNSRDTSSENSFRLEII